MCGGGGGVGGGGGGVDDINLGAAIFTASTELCSLMKIFLTVFKIGGIIALTIKGK